jgi:hypothetical protein
VAGDTAAVKHGLYSADNRMLARAARDVGTPEAPAYIEPHEFFKLVLADMVVLPAVPEAD